jgi:hypothetical protein
VNGRSQVIFSDVKENEIAIESFLYFFTVHENGEVCISILHEPGEDKFGYETASERWLPIHTVESILISVISMITDPNDESPANVDAAVSTKTFEMLLKVISIWSKTGGGRYSAIQWGQFWSHCDIVQGVVFDQVHSNAAHPTSGVLRMT